MKHQDEINDNLTNILGNESVLNILLEFEGMLDGVDLYAFANWRHGEIVAGPTLERYWVTVSLMYPAKLMPDPLGAKRLEGYGCKVSYEEITYKRPVKIVTQDDLITDDEGRRVPKTLTSPAWLITIRMPRRYIDEAVFDSNIEDSDIDRDAVNDAYDEGIDNEAILKGGAEGDNDQSSDSEPAPGEEQQ